MESCLSEKNRMLQIKPRILGIRVSYYTAKTEQTQAGRNNGESYTKMFKA